MPPRQCVAAVSALSGALGAVVWQIQQMKGDQLALRFSDHGSRLSFSAPPPDPTADASLSYETPCTSSSPESAVPQESVDLWTDVG